MKTAEERRKAIAQGREKRVNDMTSFLLEKIDDELESSTNRIVHVILTTEEFNSFKMVDMKEFASALEMVHNQLKDLGYQSEFFTRKCQSEFGLFTIGG